MNRQIIRAIDIPVYLLNRQGFVVKLLNTPTEKANRLPFQNLGTLNIKDLVTDADECRKHMASLLALKDGLSKVVPDIPSSVKCLNLVHPFSLQ